MIFKAIKYKVYFLILFVLIFSNFLLVAHAGQGDSCNYPQLILGQAKQLETQTLTAGNSPYCFEADLTLPESKTLTIEPGVVIKFGRPEDSWYKNGANLLIAGALNALGSKDNPIVFTSIYDDSYAGDTNNDSSATFPKPGDWNKISFYSTSIINIDYAVFKYGARKSWSMISADDSSNTSIAHSFITDSYRDGISINKQLKKFENNKIYNNHNFGVVNYSYDILADLRFNWWGSSDGPFVQGIYEPSDLNSQRISGFFGNNLLNFDPWLVEPDKDAPNWRRDIQAGDILYVPYSAGVGHTGLYIGNGQLIEAQGDINHPFDSNFSKVKLNLISSYDYPNRTNVYLLRVKKPDNLNDIVWNQMKNNAIKFALQQALPEGKPYDWGWYGKDSSIDAPKWYCSELVWASYFNQGIDLEYSHDPLGIVSPVSPAEIFLDNDTYIVNGHHEEINPGTWRDYVLLMVLSPVEIEIIDSNGNVMTKNNINIPGATYMEDDVDASGHAHDKIYLPAGQYTIKVFKKNSAGANETYSLALANIDGNIFEYLAKDKIVPEDGGFHEYIFIKEQSLGQGSFFDKENTKENVFSATTLDMQADLNENFSVAVEPEILADASAQINNSGSLGFTYRIQTNNLSGDLDLCNALGLKVRQNNIQVYNGSLVNLNENLGELNSSEISNFEFTAVLADNSSSLQNKICNFNFVFESWQKDKADYSATAGFSDYEILSLNISSGQWIADLLTNIVINEVYYDTKTDEEEGDNEWIEIYNPGSDLVDISGWQICDNNSCDIIPQGSGVPAGGFAIITSASSTFNFWEIPTSTVKIILDNKIGNGLANNDDRVILVNLDLEQVDAMSYGSDTYAFDPSCLDLEEGHSLSRAIVGQDTDTADDWADLAEPSPGL
ncbi:MAG: lamin tail domain-containing protein [Patescibacteria group bacterium]